jgi:hypothetical protein
VKEGIMSEKRQSLSVANDIAALALVNIQDIFHFVLTASDDEIEERYGSERIAIEIAEKYLEIAKSVPLLEYRLSGWDMKYSQPIKGGNGRIEKTACFYDVKETES